MARGANTESKIDSSIERGRSTIEFTYLDLDDAVAVATAIHGVGGYSCEWDQLAAKMNQSADGGGFRLRVMTARSFGLLTYEKRSVQLTELGSRIVDPKREKAARDEAFLTVPLHRVAFEKLRGNLLPQPAALDQMMEQWGVAPKQKEKARQAFMRSAKQAGFFDLDATRLVKPPVGGEKVPDGEGVPGKEKGKAHEVQHHFKPEIPGTNQHPFIEGLLKTLPAPGTDWPAAARAKWLQAAANIFDLMYVGANTDIEVKISEEKGDQP